MKSRFAAVLSVFLLVFGLINYYIGWHGKLVLRQVFHTEGSAVYWVLFWLVAFSYLIGRMGSGRMPERLAGGLKLIGAYWLAVMLYMVILLPFADLAGWVASTLSVPSSVYVAVLALAVGGLVLLVLLRGAWNARNPIIRSYAVTVAKSAGPLKELRVAVASDLHLGTIVGNKQLQVLVDRINSLEPDLILFPGDVIDDDINPFIRQKMGDIMKQLRSRLGIYAVLGNHEYIGGHIKEFGEQMKACGIDLLKDRSVLVAGEVYIIGRKDRAAGRFGPDRRMELDELLEGVDKSRPLIMMDHQPYHLDKAAAAGIDVMLSGHTHRGQMAPNHWITGRLFELDWGYLKKEGLHAIVSSGYGTWGPPIRIGSRSELIDLRITFA